MKIIAVRGEFVRRYSIGLNTTGASQQELLEGGLTAAASVTQVLAFTFTCAVVITIAKIVISSQHALATQIGAFDELVVNSADGRHRGVERGDERDEVSSVSNLCAGYWRGGGGDAHDGVRAVHAVAEVPEGYVSPELLHSRTGLME